MRDMDERLKQLVLLLRTEETRWDAILELKLLDEPQLVPALIKLLGDPDWIVRWCIAEKLGEMLNPTAIPALTRLFKDRDFHVRKNAVKALVKFGPEVSAYLVTQFSNPHFSVRRHISLIISHFGERAVPYLTKDFLLRDWVSANRIIYSIYWIDSPEREEILLGLLSNVDVQKPLVILMGQMKYLPSVPHLIRLYKVTHLKRCIIGALEAIGEKQSYPVIISALSKGNTSVRALAEQIILKIGKPMLGYLVRGFMDPKAPIEKLIYLIEIIGPEAIMPTVHRLATRNSEFQSLAKSLLTKYPSDLSSKRGGLFNIFGE